MHRAVERYLSPQDVAFLLGFEVKWVYKRKHLFAGAVDLDGDLRIPASSVNKYLDEHLIAPKPLPEGIAARSVGELRRKANAAQ
jgi:hypothetical protein